MHLQILPFVKNRGGAPELDFYYINILNRCKWNLLFGGEEVLLYQRKWSGVRCSCWDPLRMQASVDSPCPDCFGVGFLGGYYRPLTIFISLLSATAIQNEIREEGIKRIFSPTSWTLWEPGLRNGDFIVRNNNNGERLWIVDKTETRWRGKILRQLFSTNTIERNHPVYTIPI